MCGRYLVDDETYADIWEMTSAATTKFTPSTNPLPSTPNPPPHSLNSQFSTPTTPLSSLLSQLSTPTTPLSSFLSQPPTPATPLSSLLSQLSTTNTPSLVINGEVFPTNIAPVITRDGAEAVKWGFPHWKGAGVIINARAETASEKTMFRKPLFKRRCVIPSSGYFEWSHASGGKKKYKYLLRRPGERILYMAGMVNIFRDPTGSDYSAFVILTTAANEYIAPIHDRMPVILALDERDQWLNDDKFMDHTLTRPGPELQSSLQE